MGARLRSGARPEHAAPDRRRDNLHWRRIRRATGATASHAGHRPGLDRRIERGMRLGLLSTARINDAILAGASEADGVEVVAVASRDAERAQQYAAEHGIPRAHGTYEALLEDGDVDAVYVSVPNSLHHTWAMRALAAGKHVLCEKPYTRRPAEAAEAFDAADAAGLVLMEGFMYRHHPQTRL